MSEAIEIEMGTPEVSIDYDSLGQSLLEECGESITEIANEAIEHYVSYELDISEQVHDAVSDAVGDSVNSQVESLLDEVGPSSLCGLGSSFRDAIEIVLTHHIDMKQVLINNYAIETSGGISKLVQDALQKEMVVNVSFVDKQPAQVVQETSNSATDLIPGPVDEINTRSENV